MQSVSRSRKLFTLEDANRTLPLVSRIVQDIVRIYGRMADVELQARKLVRAGDEKRAEEFQDQYQELSYECAEYLEELKKIGCELKDPRIGLVDFPAQLGDRFVWLCWKLGESKIRFWHELHTGFAGRRPVKGIFDAGPGKFE